MNYATLIFLLLLSIPTYKIIMQMLPTIRRLMDNITETPGFDRYKFKFYVMLSLMVPPALKSATYNFDNPTLSLANYYLMYANYLSILILFAAVYFLKTPEKFLREVKFNAGEPQEDKKKGRESVSESLYLSTIKQSSDGKESTANLRAGVKYISEMVNNAVKSASIETIVELRAHMEDSIGKRNAIVGKQLGSIGEKQEQQLANWIQISTSFEAMGKRIEIIEENFRCANYSDMRKKIISYEEGMHEKLRVGRSFAAQDLEGMVGANQYAQINFSQLLPKTRTIHWNKAHRNGSPDKIGLALFLMEFFKYNYNSKNNLPIMAIADYYFDIITPEGNKNPMRSKDVSDAKLILRNRTQGG